MTELDDPQLSGSFLQAAFLVIRDRREALSARRITAFAIEDGYLEVAPRGGITPWQTMKSKLSVHIRKHGNNSIFVRTRPGRFYLRELLDDPGAEYSSPPFRAGPPNERIMAFNQHVLDHLGRFQGIRNDWRVYFEGLAFGDSCRIHDRMFAENSNDMKQLLTYTLVRSPEGGLLCFDRGRVNRVDDSLRGRACVGFGGHVKAVVNNTLFDADEVGLFRSAAAELVEELRFPEAEAASLVEEPASALRIVGVLNDDSSANGLRHFAFVLEYVVKDTPDWSRPRGKEKSINQVRWLTRDSARSESVHQFEFWSQLCIRHFAPELASATPNCRVKRARRLRRSKVVCIVGQIGSGKTEAVSVLRGEFGFREVNSGRVVARLLGVPPVPETPRDEFQHLAEQFIQQPTGPDRLGRSIAAEAMDASGRTVVDGIRHLETLDVIRKIVGRSQVAVVYVHSPFDVAFDMYRAREDPHVSLDRFAARRAAPVETQVPQMLDIADAAIYNWIGYEAYLNVVRELGREFLAS